MQGIQVYSAIGAEIGQQIAAEDLDRARRAELRASCAETLGVIDAWLATSTRRTPIERRDTTPSRCGYCSGRYSTNPPCCGWSAGAIEWRITQPETARYIEGEWVPVEHRPAQIVCVVRVSLPKQRCLNPARRRWFGSSKVGVAQAFFLGANRAAPPVAPCLFARPGKPRANAAQHNSIHEKLSDSTGFALD